MKIVKNLLVADKITSKRERFKKYDRAVIKMRTNKERL
jgi:hypothetical protein